MTTSATGIELSVNRGADPETAYRAAVERDPANPWWNSRLVTFLIDQGRLRSARKAWREAIDRVASDGEQTSGWLADHFHHWVCQAWLEAGSPSDAYEVLSSVPDAVIEDSARMTSIRQQVLDAGEAEALGGSVYPASYPVDRRWNQPDALADEFEGKPLKDWFPGRILKADEDVQVFYGTKIGEEYRSMLGRIERSDWASMSKMANPSADDFVYLGLYEGDAHVVLAQPKTEYVKSDRILPIAHFECLPSRSGGSPAYPRNPIATENTPNRRAIQ